MFIFSILFSVIGYGQELLSNGNFESSVAKWKSYCDAAGIAPVDGVGGGVAGFAISASTSSPLAGKSSGVITKDAVNRQGCGIATDFIVAEENKAKVLQITIPYKVTSGTYADDQYKVYVYDIDNASMIEAAPTFIKNSSLTERYRGVFQTSLTGVNYRLIIHNASTSAVASTFKLESSVSTQTTATGSFATDWESYTSGCGGAWSTNTTWVCKRRLVGDALEVIATATLSGAPNSAQFTANLPSGFTINTAKINGQAPAGTTLGSASILDSGTQVFTGSVYFSTDTSVTVTFGAANGAGVNTNNGVVNQSNPMTFAINDVISVNFSVPVVGKTSNTVLSSEYSQTDIFARATNASGSLSASPSDITWTTVDKDTVGGFSGTSNVVNYTIKTTGYYDIGGQLFSGGTSALNGYFIVALFNTTTSTLIAESFNSYQGAQSINAGESFSFENIYLTAGTQIKIRANTDKSSPSIISNTTQNYLSIKKSNGGGAVQVAELQSMAARYTTSSGQSIPNGTFTIIDFGTKDYDQSGLVTTGGSWKFTAQVSGIYSLSGFVNFINGGGWAAGEEMAVEVAKNGSNYARVGAAFAQATNTNYVGTPLSSPEIRLLAGEYIDVRVYQNSGAALALFNNATLNWVAVKRVGNY